MADQDFPLGMDHLVRDAIEQLRPKLKFPSTLEECLVAVDKIEKEAVEKLEQMGLNNNGGLGMSFTFCLKKRNKDENISFKFLLKVQLSIKMKTI